MASSGRDPYEFGCLAANGGAFHRDARSAVVWRSALDLQGFGARFGMRSGARFSGRGRARTAGRSLQSPNGHFFRCVVFGGGRSGGAGGAGLGRGRGAAAVRCPGGRRLGIESAFRVGTGGAGRHHLLPSAGARAAPVRLDRRRFPWRRPIRVAQARRSGCWRGESGNPRVQQTTGPAVQRSVEPGAGSAGLAAGLALRSGRP